jgi:hypothetical protein
MDPKIWTQKERKTFDHLYFADKLTVFVCRAALREGE